MAHGKTARFVFGVVFALAMALIPMAMSTKLELAPQLRTSADNTDPTEKKQNLVTNPEAPALGVHPLKKADKKSMQGVTWHHNCPVPLEDLVKVRVMHVDFAGNHQMGELVVHQAVSAEINAIFQQLFEARFKIDRIRPAHFYGGSDDRSMADNNTSAFNCRPVTGQAGVFSTHSYGMAVDINPLVNPYVRKGKVLPPGGQQYLKRRNIRPGMVVPKDICHKAFLQKGWVWGGSWRSVRDYQHFEKKKYKVLSRKSGKRTYNHKSKRENDLVPRQKGSMRQDNRILTKEIGLNHD